MIEITHGMASALKKYIYETKMPELDINDEAYIKSFLCTCGEEGL